MKLEVGMVARTQRGLLIDIIHDFDSKLCAYKRSDIKKASFNIIDLIEVGDYVNGRKVTDVWKDELVLYAGATTTYTIKDEDIEEVLTKEQYSANVYKLGDDNK